jgi:hypothetical protein
MDDVVAEPDGPGQPDRLRTAVEQGLGAKVDRDAGHLADA